MSLHIQRFIDRIRGHEAKGSRDFAMPMADAKGLHADLTELLLELNTLRHAAKTGSTVPEAVVLKGGGFK